MSKTKQKPIDELLKEALVPEDEQPYEVPGNWVWVRLGYIVNINPPKPKLEYSEDKICSFLPMNAINPEKGQISYLEERLFGKVKKGYTYFEENDILFAKITPCMENGNSVIAEGLLNGFGFGSTEFYVIRAPKKVDNRYIYYLVRSEWFRKRAKAVMTGAVGQQRVPKNFLETYKIALPPLNEQKRIVDKIERLFAKIDEAKRLVEEVKESVELRRAAILDRAFRGELGTNDPFEAPNQINEKEIVPPNEQPYKVPENWVWVKLKSCLKNLQYGYTASSSVSEEGPKYLRITDIQNGHVDWEKVPHCKIDEEQLEKYRLNKGDIVIARTGATTGKSFLIDDVPCAVFASYLIRLTINDYLDARYLWNYLKSPMYWKQITVVQKGIAQPGANAQIIGGLSLPLPPVREQQRIAEKVDFLLNKLDSEKQLALEIEQKIDLIKQSILSKAFRGELGTNDPNDEHAIELLKEVLKSK